MSDEQHIPSDFLATRGFDSSIRKIDGTLIGTQIGVYEMLSVLGVGGMGEVYRGRDTRLGRAVAIKVLPQWLDGDGERLARFKKEAKTLASLNHPHIAAIYDVVDTKGINAIVMELVEGPTLADRIAQGRIPSDEAVSIAKQIAEALEAAHEQGIVHRDLKPANIKVRPDGTVKILDFGLAKATQPLASESAWSTAPGVTAHTAMGAIVGTPAYMSPEQARGQTTDKRSDIWAFGCVLYEMLTGRPAFKGETASDLFAAVLTTEPDWAALPACEHGLNLLIRRCLEKDSRRRLRDIGDARLALEGGFGPPPPVEPNRKGAPVAFWISTTAACFATALAAWAIYSRADPPAQPTVRYEINPPPNDRVFSFALSPDGLRLAFTTVPETSSEQRRLWVRRLDSLEAEPVPGAEGAYGAFWSPDSRTIAYFTSSELRRVDLLGGPPEKICTAPLQVTGAWNHEGVIVFTGPDGQLHRVNADGGQILPATKLDVTRQEMAHRFPQFLPDGQHFMYTAISAIGENSGLYVTSLQSTETSRLLATNTNVAFTRDGRGRGYLMYVRGETLLGQRFDLDRLTLEGDPFPVGDNVAAPTGIFDNIFPQFSTSIDGVISYQRGGALKKELVWLDRSGRRLSTVGEPADYSNLDLSPDERMLAISRLDPELRTRDVWTFDLERGVSTRFTKNGADDTNPVWSPDGRLIAYTSMRKGKRAAYVKEVDGTREEQLLYESKDPMTPQDWSSDGRFLMLSDSALLMEGERKLIPLPDWSNPSISPDGKWVAYHSDESGRTEIYVQSFPEVLAGKSERRWRVSNSGGTHPQWRRDTQELFYLAPDNQLMAVTVKRNGAALDPGLPKSLFRVRIEAAERRTHYQPAANGQRFLVVQLPEFELPKPITVVVNWAGALMH